MLRIAMVVLALSALPAQAFSPVVCTFDDRTNPPESWVIDGKTMRFTREPVVEHKLLRYKRGANSDSWSMLLDETQPGSIKISGRRSIEWIFANSGRVRGKCHDVTRSAQQRR